MTKAIQNQRIDNIERKNQFSAIKKRLNKVFDSSGLTINGLKNKLNEGCDVEINYETLRKTLSFDCSTLDIYCVIAMCRALNLDIEYILSEANNPADTIFYEETLHIPEGFAELNDEKYLQKFYGYFYSSKRNNPSVDTFSLEIRREGARTVATLCITYSSINPGGGERVIGKKILTGRPILINSQNIYIVFTGSRGSFYVFSFGYVQYNVRNLYFRRGAILTQGRDTNLQPMLQSFVMFDREVKEESLDVVKGLLLLNDNTFHISSESLNILIEKDENVAKLVSDLKYIFDHNCQTYYSVDELQILNSLNGSLSRTDALRALQLMKSYSTDAKRIYFSESDDYSELSKFLTQ